MIIHMMAHTKWETSIKGTEANQRFLEAMAPIDPTNFLISEVKPSQPARWSPPLCIHISLNHLIHCSLNHLTHCSLNPSNTLLLYHLYKYF